MNTKRIIAITTITTLAAAGLANAQNSNQITGQTSSTSQTGPMHTFMQNLTDAQKTVLTQARALFKAGNSSAAETLLTQNGIKIGAGMHERNERGAMKGKGGESRKAINDAIIAGNFSVFQQVASTSPLAKIDQATFNLLTPQFVARKNAEDQIASILKNAGIEKTK